MLLVFLCVMPQISSSAFFVLFPLPTLPNLSPPPLFVACVCICGSNLHTAGTEIKTTFAFQIMLRNRFIYLFFCQLSSCGETGLTLFDRSSRNRRKPVCFSWCCFLRMRKIHLPSCRCSTEQLVSGKDCPRFSLHHDDCFVKSLCLENHCMCLMMMR